MKYANQRNIVISRDIPTKNSHEAYITMYCRNMETAARNLSGNAFKLYCYLASNKNGYSLDYSPQDFVNKYGVSINSARDAFRALSQSGYLIETKNNCYRFYEVPATASSSTDQSLMPAPNEKREFISSTTSEKAIFTFEEVLERSNNDKALALERWNKGKPINFEF